MIPSRANSSPSPRGSDWQKLFGTSFAGGRLRLRIG